MGHPSGGGSNPRADENPSDLGHPAWWRRDRLDLIGKDDLARCDE
jgi:hypothetical protein